MTTMPRTKTLRQCTCPNCWQKFKPGDVLWIPEHEDLLGDPLLGEQAMQRFLPTRFSVDGRAMDARGFPCSNLACPKCHLPVPRPLLEMEPIFASIFGSPASGKSFFLTSLIWESRRVLPSRFSISLTDAEPLSNLSLRQYEERVFLNGQPEKPVPLEVLIEKTQQRQNIQPVSFGNQVVNYPRPFLFTMRPLGRHPNAPKAAALSRVLCLYDNAGESFEPGEDTVSDPVTRHLAESSFLMFTYDPLQDQRFFRRCQEQVGRYKATSRDMLRRQELVLAEAANRVRKFVGLPQTAKHKQHLIVVVTKLDQWSHLLWPNTPKPDVDEPIVGADGGLCRLDVERIRSQSQAVQSLLGQYCPDLVAAAEDFCEEVTYVPVTALGWETEPDPDTGLISIRPEKVRPYGATVPLLYGIYRHMKGWIGSLKQPKA